ncbi:hypothetical protein BDY19DRAFT_1049115 [Irpex rosettiformis]|uniref:Uncharacterized protein n=1 Tax=Irpex rosettiformis TaxID=378272 RepID=A0ACB8U0H3_9APHY|nr:hypothetical protein BDY19DRAFT_1049115 [Irpex rosettiformis]
MGRDFYDEIPDDPKLVQWIRDQKIFHVATAPLNGGHVNVSPKGQPSFKLVNPKACWYLDLTGSGNETISHLYEPGNGRITILFQAFEGPPNIVRLFGQGRVFERDSPEFNALVQSTFTPTANDEYDFPTPELLPGARAIIWIDITMVGLSCGYAVPVMEFVSHRDQLNKYFQRLEDKDASVDDPFSLPYESGFRNYMVTMNSWSVDGLPGLKFSNNRASHELVRSTMVEAGLEPPTGHRQNQSEAERLHLYRSGWVFALGISIGILSTVMVKERKVLMSLLPAFLSH